MGSDTESQPIEGYVKFVVVPCFMLAFYMFGKTRRISRTEDLPNDCSDMWLYGVVTREISDGDGFRFFHCPWLRSRTYTPEDDRIDVRLAGIDAPEMGNSRMPRQPFAEESKQHLESLIEGEIIKIKVVGKDQYNRVLAFAYLPIWFLKPFLLNRWLPINFCDWFQINFLYTNVNLEMVKEGYAFVYEGQDAKYDGYKLTLESLEKKAKREKKGLWIRPNPVTPMEHKKRFRQ